MAGMDMTGAVGALAALAGVVALAVLLGRVARMVRLPGLAVHVAGRSGARRLAVVESLALDGRRRLVLVECDGAPVLLLLGAGNDVVAGWPAPGEPRPAGPSGQAVLGPTPGAARE